MIDQYQLEKKSIKQALSGDWQGAILTNLEILKEYPKDINCLNRLAKAQMEIGDFDDAKSILNRILSLDSFNSVAKANLAKLLVNGKNHIVSPISYQTSAITNISFIEEPGKTKVVNLVNLGDPSVLNSLHTGEEVFLRPSRKIKIVNNQKQYLGCLPDDLSLSLCNLVKMGNIYQLLIKSSNKNEVELFIRETVQAKKLRGMPSFFDSKSQAVPLMNPHKLNEMPLEIYDTTYNDDETD